MESVKQKLDQLTEEGRIDDWRHQWGEVQVLRRGDVRSMTWGEAEEFVSTFN